MNYLFTYVNELDLNNMLEINPDICNLDIDTIKSLIDILIELGCSSKDISNIIYSNPMYLSRDKEDILLLINKLNSLGITRLDITFEQNPWLLNLDSFEIDDFIEDKKESGLSMDDIIDLIDSGLIS